jgi:hypothetical protein
LLVTDVDTDPMNITTYYDINGFGVEVYDPENPPLITSERPNNYIEYWSNDSINEEYPHHRVEGIKIDMTAPMITLNKPPALVPQGQVLINGTATEYTSGSGIDRVTIKRDNEIIYDTLFNGESRIWFESNTTVDLGETFDILVETWDKAGHSIQERKTVHCPDYGIYDTGYIYWFNNPKIGPVNLLVTMGLSIAISRDTLYVILPGVSGEATSVKFIATQVFLKKELTFWDRNLSDGCSADLQVPFGIYKIKAYSYDDSNTQLEEYTIITKMLIITL